MTFFTPQALPSSFRDPSGFLFRQEEKLYRAVHARYLPHYNKLMSSGLFDELVRKGWLIPHQETVPSFDFLNALLPAKLLIPEELPFISYPYEWCFSQMKEAALLTLNIQSTALQKGLWLKDASAYNIQFMGTKPILIDTLSFETIADKQPWPAYRQFCGHFLGPLLLMHYRDTRLITLLQTHLDGLPLNMVSRLLPLRSRFSFGTLLHLHLHAMSEKKLVGKVLAPTTHKKVERSALFGLTDSLKTLVHSLKPALTPSLWTDYQNSAPYTPMAKKQKKAVIEKWLQQKSPGRVWDLGANTGEYSRLAKQCNALSVISMDNDLASVEQSYRKMCGEQETTILPLFMDLSNPSPSLGFEHQERDSLMARGPADTVLALALIHHLSIVGNLPLEKTAAFLSRCVSKQLIIEFIPKNDPQIQEMLFCRQDVFTDYTERNFETAFKQHFQLADKITLPESLRSLYLFVKP